MDCKIFLQKYKNILEKMNNNINNLKTNSDNPLFTSYILNDIKKVENEIKSINKFNELLKKCID